MLGDLLEDGHERRHQVLHGRRVRLDDLVQEVQRGSHHGGIFVAKHAAQLVGQVGDAHVVHLVESLERHHRLLAHVLLGVLQQADHRVEQSL